MQPIETIYNGRKHRSRLEARWSIVFEQLGIPFQYEPEGFELSDGTRYLPDFYLPQQHCWVEVKGNPSEADSHKLTQFSVDQARIDKTVRVIMVTNILEFNEAGYPCYSSGYDFVSYPEDSGWKTDIHDEIYLAMCPKCSRVDFADFGGLLFLPCGCMKEVAQLLDIEHAPQWWKDRVQIFQGLSNASPLLAAYDVARMARFEYGRSGN